MRQLAARTLIAQQWANRYHRQEESYGGQGTVEDSGGFCRLRKYSGAGSRGA